MPAKSTKSTKAKPNVAKTTGRAGLLNKKVKFNWKIAAVIGVVLTVALGYLFVRLSNAAVGGYIWSADQITVLQGSRASKNGVPSIQSVGVPDRPGRNEQVVAVMVNSETYENSNYCIEGNAAANTQFEGYISFDKNSAGAKATNTLTVNNGSAGSFSQCMYVAGQRTSDRRYIRFYLRNATDTTGNITVTRITRGVVSGNK